MDQYYKAYNNVLRMLSDRKYKIADKKYTKDETEDFSVFKFTLKEFEELYTQNGALDIKNVIDRNSKPVYVKFLKQDIDISKASISTFCTYLTGFEVGKLADITEKLKNMTLIIIYNSVAGKDNVHVAPLTLEKSLPRDKIQFFPIQRLSFCILDAVFMPTSYKLLKADNKEDSEEYKKINTYGDNKLERFALNDPVVKYFGASDKDIFEIIRSSPEGISITWRKVLAFTVPPYNKKK